LGEKFGPPPRFGGFFSFSHLYNFWGVFWGKKLILKPFWFPRPIFGKKKFPTIGNRSIRKKFNIKNKKGGKKKTPKKREKGKGFFLNKKLWKKKKKKGF